MTPAAGERMVVDEVKKLGAGITGGHSAFNSLLTCSLIQSEYTNMKESSEASSMLSSNNPTAVFQISSKSESLNLYPAASRRLFSSSLGRRKRNSRSGTPCWS